MCKVTPTKNRFDVLIALQEMCSIARINGHAPVVLLPTMRLQKYLYLLIDSIID